MKTKRLKINRGLIFILSLFLASSLVLIFLFSFKFREIIIEPLNFSSYLEGYFKEKTPLEIFLNLKKIMTDFPEIIKVRIMPNPFIGELKIKIETSKIVARICDLENCFYLDNYARIISPKVLSKNNYLMVQSYLNIEENSLLHPKLTKSLSMIFEYANWKPLILKEIKIYSNFDIGVIDEENREFLFDPNQDIEEQIKKLHLFLIKNFKGLRIDLRIPKKIYYR